VGSVPLCSPFSSMQLEIRLFLMTNHAALGNGFNLRDVKNEFCYFSSFFFCHCGSNRMLLTVTHVNCSDCKGTGLLCEGGCGNSGWRPTKIKCPSRCVGNVSISVWPPSFSWSRCSTCAGTGFQLEMCTSCKGTGQTTSKCYRCQGQGKLKLGDSGYA
jgi:hypothetical protein